MGVGLAGLPGKNRLAIWVYFLCWSRVLFASSGNCRFHHGPPVLNKGVRQMLNIETKTRNSQRRNLPQQTTAKRTTIGRNFIFYGRFRGLSIQRQNESSFSNAILNVSFPRFSYRLKREKGGTLETDGFIVPRRNDNQFATRKQKKKPKLLFLTFNIIAK